MEIKGREHQDYNYNNYQSIGKQYRRMSKIKRNGPVQNIPLFIQKLSNILEDDTCLDYIDWISSGEAFNIKDINRFTDVVLPKYFKHSNFSSFIRQLNMYGFNKIRNEQGENVYMNQNFKRDQRQLLKNIKRKINQVQKEDKLEVFSPSNNNNLGKQLSQLKSRQRNLENMCRQLIDQNNRILEENNMMMKRLTTEEKQKNNKMEQLLVSLIMARGSNQLALPSSEEPRMLSLANETKPDYGPALEQFCGFLEDNNGNNRLQQALRKFQNEQKKRNKCRNYTIVHQPQIEASKKQASQAPKSQQQLQLKKEGKKKSSEDNDASMLSLGQFLNLDEAHQNGNI